MNDPGYRTIRDHRVYGVEVLVEAPTEEEARKLAISVAMRKKPNGSRLVSDWHVWQLATIIAGGSLWGAYVAEHDACFAVDD